MECEGFRMQDIKDAGHKKTGRKPLEYFIALNFPKQVVAETGQ